MNFKIIALLLISFEAVLICLIYRILRNKTNHLSENEILLKNVKDAFKRNEIKLNIDSSENMDDEIKMLILTIQNKEYEKAEFRVFEKFEVFLNELWRLKKEDNNELAANLLILIENTLSIHYDDIKTINYTPDIKTKYTFLSEANDDDTLQIIRPAWLIDKKVVVKGKVRAIK